MLKNSYFPPSVFFCVPLKKESHRYVMTYYIGMCGVVVAYLFTFSGFLKASRNNQSSLVRSYIAPYQKGLIPGKTKCPILCSRANRASNVS